MAASGDSGLAGGSDWPAVVARRARGRRDDALHRPIGAVLHRGRLERQRRRREPFRVRARLSAGLADERGSGSPRMSPSTATPTRASRSTRPRPIPGWGRGRSSAGRAWARRPGRRSSPSPTRAAPCKARGASTAPRRPCRRSTALPATDFHGIASYRAGRAAMDGPRVAHRPRPDRRPGGQQHHGPADHLERRRVGRIRPPQGQGQEGRRPAPSAARSGRRDRPRHGPSPRDGLGPPHHPDRSRAARQ